MCIWEQTLLDTMKSTRPLHVHTPLFQSIPVSAIAGRPVYLKFDNVQPSGSFKIRGIGELCQRAAARGCTEIVSSSGGNAGYAAAYAGRMLGMRVTVVVPETTPEFMRRRIQSEGANVVIHGAVWDDANKHALELCASGSAAYVPPFDHPDVWAGNASVVAEITQDLAALGVGRPAAIVVSVGGGGLYCGVVEGLKAAGLNDVPVIAVETVGAASLRACLDAKAWVEIPGISSVAKSLGAKRVARRAFEMLSEHPTECITVTDEQALRACIDFAEHHRVLVEPACGASLAVAYNRLFAGVGEGPLVVVVCGGHLVTPDLLAEWSRSLQAPK